ncbi:MAG: hypothetical protein ABW019_10770 [Chitinophagaceae bacterium]
MFNTKTILIAALAASVIASCSKSGDMRSKEKETTVTELAAPAPTTLTREEYSRSLDMFKQKIKFNPVLLVNGRVPAEELDPSDSPSGDPGTIGYTTGGYVGDPYDEVTAADGPIVQAISQQEEEQTRDVMQGQIANAKAYLNYHGLDMSDEFGYDDPRYIHAANIVMEMENTTGIPGQGGSGLISVSRENSLFGCAMQAIGINTLYEAWFDKFATKRMLIAAVGKVASRYLGWVGAAIAVYDFIDCMWG